MQQPQDMDTKMKFIIRLAEFVSRRRFILLAILVAIALLVIGYFIWSAWDRRVVENSTLLAEEAQLLYQDWQATQDEEEQAALEEDLQERLSQIIRRYPHQYATARALFIRARVAAEKENWAEAAKDFQDLARSFPQGYLAGVSLFNAAVAQEQQDQPEAAIEQYRTLAERYPDSHLVAQALFSMGRLYEALDNHEEAAAVYNRMIEEQAASGWTNAARNRIIDLQIQGKIAQ